MKTKLNNINLYSLISLLIIPLIFISCSDEKSADEKSAEEIRIEKHIKSYNFKTAMGEDIRRHISDAKKHNNKTIGDMPYKIIIGCFFVQSVTPKSSIDKLQSEIEAEECSFSVDSDVDEYFIYQKKTNTWGVMIGFNMDKGNPEKMVEKAKGIVMRIHKNQGVINNHGAGTGSVYVKPKPE